MILSMKIVLFAMCCLGWLQLNGAILEPEKFTFSHGQETRAEYKIINKNTIKVKFKNDNPFNASLWFSRILLLPSAGSTYRMSAMVQALGVTDPQARINLDVIGGDKNGASLGTSCFKKTVWAANCSSWTKIELVFKLPDNGMDAKWNKAQTFLTSISILSANGEFLLKNVRFDKLSGK